MESRKRNNSPLKSLNIKVKRQKNDSEENNESNDSFEDFCCNHGIKIEKKEVSPRVRSNKLQPLNEKNNDDDEDSFDSPPINSTVLTKPSSSGVDGFPSLTNKKNVIYLKVNTSNLREDCLDVDCQSTDGKQHFVYLQGLWSETEVVAGDMMNIIGAKKWGADDYIVSDECGLVIVNPDVLVPCTSTANSTFCQRKIVLNERFKFGNRTNKAMLLGTIMHQIFQKAILMEKRPLDTSDLLKIWNDEAINYTEELVSLSFTPKCLHTELQPYLTVVCEWINKHIIPKMNIFIKKEPISSKSIVTDVYDIEENIWDPLLGLKGKIDVTLMTRNGNRNLMESLELKTGKSGHSTVHIGQVLQYCMMLSSLYEQEIGPGNLLYLKDGVSKCVTPKAPELFGILRQRNRLARYLGEITENSLPEPITETRFCGKCDHKTMCSFYQKHEEKFSKSNPSMKEFAEAEMSHLNDSHFEYFSKWIRWIKFECKSEIERNDSQVKNIWLQPIHQREQSGTCFSNLIVEEEENISNSNRFLITFRKKYDDFAKSDSINNIKNGDMFIISSEKNISISYASVHDVEGAKIQIICDKSLKNRKDGPFHLDRYHSSSNFTTILGNLLYSMENDDIGSRLRRFLIDLEAPKPVKISDFNIPNEVRKFIVRAKLNNEQRMAVIHALASEDYTIVEGLPGSGKTTMICVLIQCFVALGKSVLLTAFTHSAVDNILTKLKTEVPNDVILRLGASSSIKEEMQCLGLKTKLKNVEVDEYYSRFKKLMKNTSIVACTCHHVPRELMFCYRKFDIVIIDEASMVLEPLLLPVIATSSRFVLVGDCRQLTPLVLSKVGKKEGAGVSTMEKLQKEHPSARVSLTAQYRMNREISKLASQLFYENRLVCGSETIAKSCIERSESFSFFNSVEEYLKMALAPDLENSSVFLDTNSLENQEMWCDDSDTSGGMINKGEAMIIQKLCKGFLESGIEAHDIGIMSAYRKQVDYLKGVVGNSALEVNTIDSYQGREKRVIIWSMTWTDNSMKKSELLRDERRINVAITRSRQKLVIIGCQKSLETIPVIYRLLQILPHHVKVVL